MSFKTIPTGNADLDRVQQNVQQAFRDLGEGGGARAPKVVTVVEAQYRVTGTEDFLVVDSTRNPVVIVLPVGAQRAPVVKNATAAGNTVTVQALDQSPIDGAPKVTVAAMASLSLVFDGRRWWSY